MDRVEMGYFFYSLGKEGRRCAFGYYSNLKPRAVGCTPQIQKPSGGRFSLHFAEVMKGRQNLPQGVHVAYGLLVEDPWLREVCVLIQRFWLESPPQQYSK